eukprot:9486279-Pyramimonas_sp.AAC.1
MSITCRPPQKTWMPAPYQARIPLWDRRAGAQVVRTVNFLLLTEVLDAKITSGSESDWTSYDPRQDSHGVDRLVVMR